MKILVLAGGSDQIALIKELKKRGHEVILVDYFENPPARPYADKHIVASTLDVDQVHQIAVAEQVNLICTACTDQALLTVAKVSEELGLPCYISYKTALNVTNKSYMKCVMMHHGIPTAKYVIVDKVDTSAIGGFQYPLVVKPVDCNSSKGVKLVETESALIKYLQEAINYSRTQTAIIEEFKVGEEISADFYVEGDRVKFLSATNSTKIANKKSFTILQSCYPIITEESELLLTSIAQSIADAFEIKDSPLLIQLIYNQGNFDVLEFSARMGGGSKYHLINVLSGVDIMSKYVDLVLGDHPTVQPCKMVNFAHMNYVYCYPGTLNDIQGLDELKSEGIIKDYFIYKTPGMEFLHSETSGDRALGYLVVADSAAELASKESQANTRIKVLNDVGEDIMMHNLI